jgi:hypothetical protein
MRYEDMHWCEENMQRHAPGNMVMNLLVPTRQGFLDLLNSIRVRHGGHCCVEFVLFEI